jgi:Galactose oxidase, central domain
MNLTMRSALVVLLIAGGLRQVLAAGCDPVRSGGPPGWTSRAAMPSVRLGATGVMVGSRIYVTHGSSPTGGPDARTFIYDRVLNTWSEGAPAHFPRTLLTGVCAEDLFGQGLVVAVGGDTLDGPTATMEIYDAASNYWTTGPPMPTARWGSGAAFVPGPGVLGGSPAAAFTW